jgi:hypothetical protein
LFNDKRRTEEENRYTQIVYDTATSRLQAEYQLEDVTLVHKLFKKEAKH